MRLLHRLASIVRWTVYRDRAERDLHDELEAFVDMAATDRMRDGAASAEARRSAVLHLGGVEQAKERVRSARHGAWLDSLGRDLRYGIRTLRRSPVFTAVALLTLALGIGANTAIFSILRNVIVRPLAYPAPEQLMRLTAHSPANPLQGFRLSTPEYLEFREMTRSFADVGAFSVGDGVAAGGSGGWAGAVNLTAGDRPVRVRSALVDDHLLATLGVQPEQGRLFAPGETDAMSSSPGLGGPPVAILSHELWQSAFGGAAHRRAHRADRRPAARHHRHHAARLRRHGQPDGDLAADRHPPGDSAASGESRSASHRATEGWCHAAGGRRRALRVPRELGRARRRHRCPGGPVHESGGARADCASVASTGSHAAAAAAAECDSRRRASRRSGCCSRRRDSSS